MKRTLAAVLLTLAALALTGAATAQTPGETSATGTVVSSTNDSLVLRMDDGTQRTFGTDFTTTLPPAPLVEGNRVTVRYNTLDGDRFQATTVVLAGEKAPAEQPLPSERPGDGVSAAPPDPLPRDTTASPASTRALPDTASDLPLIALAGFAALAGGLALTVLRRTA